MYYGKNIYEHLFTMWKKRLHDDLVRRFEYGGVPKGIPQYTIEDYLTSNGQCGLVKELDGDRYHVVKGSPTGVTPYPYEFKQYVYQIIGDDTFSYVTPAELGVNVVMLRNNYSLASETTLLEYYADLLTQTDITYRQTLINLRTPSIFHTADAKSGKSVKEFMDSVEEGKNTTITNDSIMKSVTQADYYKPTSTIIQELLNARNNILRRYYMEIGLVSSKDKSQAVLSDEMYSDYQVPASALSEALAQRKENVEAVNKAFGLNMSVRLAKPYQTTLDMLNLDNTMEDISVEGDIKKEGVEGDNI